MKIRSFVCFCVLAFSNTSLFAADRPNILFIAIDDLRPELGCYGSEIVKSPNLDALAAAGLRFDRAYCQEAICSPSRASLMTGNRPDTINIIENRTNFRTVNPNVITLPQHFISQGYTAVNMGKIYHPGMNDMEYSWSRKPFYGSLRRVKTPGGYAVAENQELYNQNKLDAVKQYGPINSRGLAHGPAFEAGPVSDDTYQDGFNTSLAIQTLGQLVKSDKPWFIGLGYSKPHLPFVAPKRYYDLYDPSEIKLAAQTTPPEGGSAIGLHESFELRTRANIPKYGPIDEELSRKLLHAYYACTSYVDAQIGRMLKALDKHGVRDNTIIIVWGDHGWHLGDYGIWGKATNYEIATRVPMIIWTPDMKVRGKATKGLVELVDMYPTLCELAGIPLPSHLEGKSFAPLLDKPNQKWKQAAFTQYPAPALREWAANPLSEGMRQTFFGPLIQDVEARIQKEQGERWDRSFFENHVMGYTVRTERYRLVRWVDYRDPTAEPLAVELYDHQNDPGETVNVADKYPEIVQRLSKLTPEK
ncbi:MAG: iduronate-2-sulfatase [Blastopirellula sp.]|nr:MAG: iduronate-2-sulfatase [Blastopirellula sp.]